MGYKQRRSVSCDANLPSRRLDENELETAKKSFKGIRKKIWRGCKGTSKREIDSDKRT
jgi:hypothetical protein